MNEIPASPREPRPPELPRQDKRCSKCWKLIGADDPFCKNCGKRQTGYDAWYYHPVWILILALFVIGPFALPLVWLSPKSSQGVKIALTAIIVIYTVLTVYYSYLFIMLTFHHFSDLGDMEQLLQQ